MNPIVTTLASLSLAAIAGAAQSGNAITPASLKGLSQPERTQSAPPLLTVKCPPGLAKKTPPCIPPGQAKAKPVSKAHQYGPGDSLFGDYRVIRYPERYYLDRGGNYVVAGDYVYRIDPDTRKVLNLIGAVADILQ